MRPVAGQEPIRAVGTDAVQSERPESAQGPGAPAGRVGVGLILALALVAYASALTGGYVWDDPDLLTENPLVRTLDGLGRIWFTTQTRQYYPLVFSSFWIEYQLWGLHPFGYHLVNVLLHATNALLVWRILAGLGVPGAWLAGAIFAVHPVHVESVAWVTERKNVLSGLFYLLALRSYLAFELDRQGRRYAAALALFVCALLSKSVTASLPAAALIALWYRGDRIDWRTLARVAPFLLIGLVSGLFTAFLEISKVGAAGDEWDLALGERLLLAPQVLWFYLGKLVWPAELAFSYRRWEIDTGSAVQYLPWVGTLLVGGALLVFRERLGRGPAAALVFFGVTLAPVLGFLNVYPMLFSWVADHFQYLASIGPIALIAAGLTLAARALPSAWRRATPAAAGALLLVLVVLTFRQGLAYQSEETLWRDTLRKNPESWLAHANLGRVLLERGEAEEAIAHSREAIRIRPTSSIALNNLGRGLFQVGRRDEGVAMLQRAIAVAPENHFAQSNLGGILVASGRIAEGRAMLEEALRIEPDFQPALVNLGVAHLNEREFAEAERALARALDLDPFDLLARGNLATALEAQGRFDEAVALLRAGQAIDPGEDAVGALEERIERSVRLRARRAPPR